MKIRMLKTTPGSVDGIKVATYEAGKEYDLGASPGAVDLGKALVGAKLAEEVADEPAAAPVSIMSVKPAGGPEPEPELEPETASAPEENAATDPDNKAVPVAPERKGPGRPRKA
jgi:hypothetical protein